jgi:hypothetical protein
VDVLLLYVCEQRIFKYLDRAPIPPFYSSREEHWVTLWEEREKRKRRKRKIEECNGRSFSGGVVLLQQMGPTRPDVKDRGAPCIMDLFATVVIVMCRSPWWQ